MGESGSDVDKGLEKLGKREDGADVGEFLKKAGQHALEGVPPHLTNPATGPIDEYSKAGGAVSGVGAFGTLVGGIFELRSHETKDQILGVFHTGHALAELGGALARISSSTGFASGWVAGLGAVGTLGLIGGQWFEAIGGGGGDIQAAVERAEEEGKIVGTRDGAAAGLLDLDADWVREHSWIHPKGDSDSQQRAADAYASAYHVAVMDTYHKFAGAPHDIKAALKEDAARWADEHHVYAFSGNDEFKQEQELAYFARGLTGFSREFFAGGPLVVAAEHFLASAGSDTDSAKYLGTLYGYTAAILGIDADDWVREFARIHNSVDDSPESQRHADEFVTAYQAALHDADAALPERTKHALHENAEAYAQAHHQYGFPSNDRREQELLRVAHALAGLMPELKNHTWTPVHAPSAPAHDEAPSTDESAHEPSGQHEHGEHPNHSAAGAGTTASSSMPHSSAASTAVGWPHEVTVSKGDSFWKIAHDALAATWHREPTNHEVAAYSHSVIAANHDRLVPNDPDRIVPGQVFVLPPPPADPSSETDAQEGSSAGADQHHAAGDAHSSLGTGGAQGTTTPASLLPDGTDITTGQADHDSLQHSFAAASLTNAQAADGTGGTNDPQGHAGDLSTPGGLDDYWQQQGLPDAFSQWPFGDHAATSTLPDGVDVSTSHFASDAQPQHSLLPDGADQMTGHVAGVSDASPIDSDGIDHSVASGVNDWQHQQSLLPDVADQATGHQPDASHLTPADDVSTGHIDSDAGTQSTLPDGADGSSGQASSDDWSSLLDGSDSFTGQTAADQHDAWSSLPDGGDVSTGDPSQDLSYMTGDVAVDAGYTTSDAGGAGDASDYVGDGGAGDGGAGDGGAGDGGAGGGP